MFIAFWIVGKHLKFWNEVLYNQNLNQIALAEPLNSSISARGMYSFLGNLYSSKKKFEMDNIFHTYCLPNFWQRLLTFQILKERYQSRLPIQLVSILGSAKEVLPSILMTIHVLIPHCCKVLELDGREKIYQWRIFSGLLIAKLQP